MVEPFAVGSMVRFLPSAPPLLRGHYGWVLKVDREPQGSGWSYLLEAYPWIWKPRLKMNGEHLAALSPEGAARHIYVTAEDAKVVPGGATDGRLDTAVTDFEDALTKFQSFLRLTDEQVTAGEGLDWIWVTQNGWEAARVCGILDTQTLQAEPLGRVWDDLVQASGRVATEMARYVDDES